MVNASDILDAKILIVDDQEANVSLLERILHGAGYTRVASTLYPREVCELHRNNRYDLILLDLQMPDMDGFEVMEGLKEIEIDGYLSVLAGTGPPAGGIPSASRAIWRRCWRVSTTCLKSGCCTTRPAVTPRRWNLWRCTTR